MSEIIVDPPDTSCYLLFSRPGIEESQSLGPDLFSSRARVRARTLRQGIDLSSLCSVADVQRVLRAAWAAVAHGEITPAEGARIARLACSRLRGLRRFARLERRLR
jgi:hypothetical protein